MSQKHLPGGPRTNGNHADRLMHDSLLEHFACLTEKWLHITLRVSQLQRINEKVFIRPFRSFGVYCIGISRALDRHRSLQKFLHGSIDDHSS